MFSPILIEKNSSAVGITLKNINKTANVNLNSFSLELRINERSKGTNK